MHIALATDGSANGNAGVDLLIAAGPEVGERISVLVVQPDSALASRGLTAPAEGGDAEDTALTIATWQADRLQSAGFDAEPVVLHGDAAEEIVRAARESNADLIIMGIKGSSMLRRLLIGSVSAAVARLATAPVLLTHDPASLERMLVVSDNTAPSVRGAAVAEAIPARLLRRAIFLHVNPDGDPGASIRASFQKAAGTLQSAGIPTEHLERTGNEVEVMVHVARDMDATLVVVAPSGGQFEGKPLIGTTARGLLEQVDASVLIAR